MKKQLRYSILVLLVTSVSFFSCKEENYVPLMDVSTKSISFPDNLDSLNITLATDNKWSVSFDDATIPGWLQLDQTGGNSGSSTIKFKTISLNTTGATRRAIVRITCDNGQARRIKVYQAPKIYPSYNTAPIAPDASGMSSTATQLIAKIKLGINLGNTLELKGVNADPTEANIKFIKQMGFNAVRIPCGWDYVGGAKDSPTSKINPAYVAKVKQVVQWCVENDLYVFVNIHWDGGWLESKKKMDGTTESNNYNPASSRKDSVNAKQKALWQQIATSLRDFDEHLMFASANEPNAETAAEMEILLTYHKTFIDAVRSTGGRNTYRTLIVQGATDYISPDDFAAFNDPTPNRLAFEWHTYSPSSFTILSNDKVDGGWDDVRFYWGAGNHSTLEPSRNSSYGEETELLAGYNQIKTKFIDKGIPCIMGEYSAQRWNATSKFKPLELDKHNKSVDDWYTFNTKQCKAIGGAPFTWDTGGLFNRETNVVNDQRTLDAIITGSK
jgi:endoglucanase